MQNTNTSIGCWEATARRVWLPVLQLLFSEVTLYILALASCPNWAVPKLIPVTRPPPGWVPVMWSEPTWSYAWCLHSLSIWHVKVLTYSKSLSQKSSTKQEIKITPNKTKLWDSTHRYWRKPLTMRKKLPWNNSSMGEQDQKCMESSVSFLISGNIVAGASFKRSWFSMGWGLHKNHGIFFLRHYLFVCVNI